MIQIVVLAGERTRAALAKASQPPGQFADLRLGQRFDCFLDVNKRAYDVLNIGHTTCDQAQGRRNGRCNIILLTRMALK